MRNVSMKLATTCRSRLELTSPKVPLSFYGVDIETLSRTERIATMPSPWRSRGT